MFGASGACAALRVAGEYEFASERAATPPQQKQERTVITLAKSRTSNHARKQIVQKVRVVLLLLFNFHSQAQKVPSPNLFKRNV